MFSDLKVPLLPSLLLTSAHQVLQQSHKELQAIVDLHETGEGNNIAQDSIDDSCYDDEDDSGKRRDFIDIYLEKLEEFKREGHSLLTDHGNFLKCVVLHTSLALANFYPTSRFNFYMQVPNAWLEPWTTFLLVEMESTSPSTRLFMS